MTGSQIFVLLLLAFYAHGQSSGTDSYFISPHGLGRTPEVDMALDKIKEQIRVKRTTYNHSTITYVLDNVTIGTAYKDAKTVVNILNNDKVMVTGGRVEFTYRFNYTKIEDRNNVTGYGYGSVLSDPLTYNKQLAFCNGFLCWILPSGKGIDNLTLVENRMRIKRMEPFDQSDLKIMEDMLDKVFTSVDPANFEVQILEIFNQVFPLALNNSLNHQIFGNKISYTYYSNSHREMKMNIFKQLYGLDLNTEIGYNVVFVTKIENWTEPLCNTTVTLKPNDFAIYGDSQNFQANCIYEGVVNYMQANGWLDAKLDNNWMSSSFQFYAGDLFDLINNLHLTFSPRAMLDGSCIAQKTGLRFYASSEFEANSFTLDVIYNCNLKGTNKDGLEAPVLKFRAVNKIYIKAGVTTKTLSFKIFFADILNMRFQPVGSYFVSNIHLAMSKAKSVLKSLFNTYTFGTGFPTVIRKNPKVRVNVNETLYYDPSHFRLPFLDA